MIALFAQASLADHLMAAVNAGGAVAAILLWRFMAARSARR